MWRALLLLSLLACRDRDAALPDGSVGADAQLDGAPARDASPGVDASAMPPPDANVPCESTDPAGAVTVRGPAGQQVVFHDAAGAVLAQAQLDAQGLASSDIPPCGAVTLAGGGGKLYTVLHVMPGETVDFTIPFPASTSRMLSVSFPAYAGATLYSVRPAGHGYGCSGFGDVTSPITLTLNADCIAADQTVSFVLVASDANGQLLAYADVAGVPLAASGTTTASVSQWRTDLRAVSGSVTNLPDPTWQPSVSFNNVLADLFAGLRSRTSLLAIGATVFVDARVEHPSGHESGIDWLMKVVPAASAQALVLDGSSDFAPHVATINRDNTELARPLIWWTTSRAVPATDAIAVIADWQQEQWFLVAPPNQPGAVRFPDLPAALRPTSAPQTGWGAQAVMVVAFSQLPTYAALRQHPLALWYPTFYADPTSTFLFQSSASGDYDQP